MGAGTGWFHGNYWHANYWHANYWAPTGAASGQYWHIDYWNGNYWHENYWALSSGGTGDIIVNDDVNRFLTNFVTRVDSGPQVLVSTATLTINAFQADANLDIDPPITTAALALAQLNPAVGTSGYILGDIDLTLSPESTITITYGMAPDAAAVPTQGHHPTTNTPNGLDVGVGDVAQLSISSFDVLANNNVAVEPVPQTLTLNSFDSPAAGIGELIEVEGVPRTFSTPTHTITGIPVALLRPNVVNMSLQGLQPDRVLGQPDLFVPGTPFGPYDVENPDAFDYPSNYEICDRTGFRLRRGELTDEWTGMKVRPESWEPRHPQEFIHSLPDDLHGSPRPEQPDSYIDARVTADDL